MVRLDFKIAPPKLTVLTEGAVEPPSVGYSLEALHLEQPVWSAANARRATFDTVVLDRADLTRASFRETGWQDVRFNGGQASGSDFTSASIRRLEMLDVRASGLIVAEADIRDMVVRNAKLDLANFRFARLTRVLFDNCLMTDADFAAAQLDHVVFVGCDLSQADFSGAHMSHVDLRRAIIPTVKGVAGLRGAKLTTAQLMALAPTLAAELGLDIDDS